jgi:hypothetical protein
VTPWKSSGMSVVKCRTRLAGIFAKSLDFNDPYDPVDRPLMDERLLPFATGPTLRRSNKLASQIRQVQRIRFRVIWRVTEFVGKSLRYEDSGTR